MSTTKMRTETPDHRGEFPRPGAHGFLATVCAIGLSLLCACDPAWSAGTSNAMPTEGGDPDAGRQWHLAGVDNSRTTGTGVVVAVLDNGITAHPDLDVNVLPGYDFISNAVRSGDGDARDPIAADPGDAVVGGYCYPGAPARVVSSWRGTQVAGIIAAVADNDLGGRGVAFGSQLLPVRVRGKCDATVQDLADAIRWSVGDHVSGVDDIALENRAKVVVIPSTQRAWCDATTQRAINIAVARKAAVVVAAGDGATDVAGAYPANCENVIVVSGRLKYGARGPHANFGAKVDVVAPGGPGGSAYDWLWSTSNNGTDAPGAPEYNYVTGTAISAAFVAGTVALMQSLHPANSAAIERALTVSATVQQACVRGCGAGSVAPYYAINDDLPWLNLGGPYVRVAETNGAKFFEYTLHLNRELAYDVTFDVATLDLSNPNNSQWATPGVDYVPMTGTGLVIPKGDTSKTVQIMILGDTAFESEEMIQLDITNVVGATPFGAATLVIHDDDGPALSVTNAEGNEGGELVFNFALAAPWETYVTASVAHPGTSIDYEDIGRFESALIPPGELAAQVHVPILVDAETEGPETIEFQTSAGAGPVIKVALGTILDGSPLTLGVDDVSMIEGNPGDPAGNPIARFTVLLSRPALADVTFTFRTVPGAGSATSGVDYVAKGTSAGLIRAGEMSTTFDVVLNPDGTPELTETFAVELLNAQGANVVLGDARGAGTIFNDDGPGLSINDVSHPEGNAGDVVYSFTVTLTEAALNAVTFNLSSADGTAEGAIDYYPFLQGVCTIPAGQLSGTWEFRGKGDTTREPTEFFYVNVSNVVGATVQDGQGVATLVDDDRPNLTINDLSINEGDVSSRFLSFTASLSKTSPVPVTFTYSTIDGSALAGSDFEGAFALPVTIPAGQLAKAVSIQVKGDFDVEPLETFQVVLGSVAEANLIDGVAIGYIINNDGALITINDIAVGEGNSGTKLLTFTVSLSQAAAGPVTYNIFSQNSNATAGSDYVAISLDGQTIPKGQLGKTHSVIINGDTSVEQTEVLTLNIRQPVGASVWDGQGLGYILNDDGPTLSILDASAGEGASGTKVMNVTVLLSQAAQVPVNFTLASANVSAAAGSDYVALDPATVHTMTIGQTNKTFQVTINGDTTVEQNETFTLTLANATGATLYDRQAIATIYNDDGPTLSVSDAVTNEGDVFDSNVATFVVSLSKASDVATSYSIATSNLTATAGSDYVARSAIFSIPAGQLSKTFAVSLNGDSTTEANETFRVTLSNISAGATLFKYTGTGTISNDD